MYEIPQQLEYNEKIMFGLTMKQLAYALIFGILILISFRSKNDIVRYGLSILFLAVGAIFIFFDMGERLKNIYLFLKFGNKNILDEKVKEYIGIEKIESNIIHGRQKLSFLRIDPLNFNIKSDMDKETITLGFQKFLNSLDFPVQILITTKKLDLEKYTASLAEKYKGEELEEYKDFLTTLIQSKEIRNREFYLIIPERSNLEIQTRLCIERLMSLGLKVHRLTDEGLINMLMNFYESSKEKEKVEDKIAQIHYIISPNIIINKKDHLITDEKFKRIIACKGYPRNVQEGFLDKIISGNDDIDISIHIEPFPIETTMIVLNKELQKQVADLYSAKKTGSLNLSLDIKYDDTIRVLKELQKGKEKLFNVSLYFNCKSSNLKELEFLTRKIESELNSLMIIPKIPNYRMIEGYKSIMPIVVDDLKIKRNITTGALSAFFPFTSPFLNIQENGVMIGLNKNKIPIIKDIFSLSNPNGLVLATSGAGKSYYTKLFIARQIMNKTKVLIVDPQGEYQGIASQYDGEIITISKDSKTIINPLDMMDHDYIEKRLSLMDLFSIMFGDLNEVQKAILDKALNLTYAKKNINIDSWHNKPPILSDLEKELYTLRGTSSSLEKPTINALLNRLSMYTQGVFGFLNKETNIDFGKDLVVFNIGDMPKQVKPVIMFLVLDFVYMRMKKDPSKKILAVDEAWSLLGRTEEAGYLFEIVKTCRKYNMGLLLITQDVADLVNSHAGGAVLANTAYTLLLRQKSAIIDSVVKTFNLSLYEKNFLITAEQGKGILIMDNDHQEIEVIASPKEHEKITTNPNEIIREVKKDERKEVNITLDTNKGYYKASDLKLVEQNFLINAGYDYSDNVAIGKTRQERYLVKVNKIEGKTHTFIVHNIKEELEKYTKNIEINITEKSDIIFELPNKKKYAIEVETGTIKYQTKKLIQKINQLELNYKNNWIIVLANAPQLPTFQQYTQKVIIRADIQKLIKGLFNINK